MLDLYTVREVLQELFMDSHSDREPGELDLIKFQL